jgi:hypothetical protein
MLKTDLEYFLLGDLNVDFTPTTESPSKNKVKEILDIYDVEQLINEPTRITATSSTLIDLCLTNIYTYKYCEVWCHTRIY